MDLLSIVGLFLVVSVASACDTGVQQSCYDEHLKPVITNPPTNQQELCSAVATAKAALTTCMEAGMEGCDADTRQQLETQLNTFIRGTAQFDAVCSGDGQPGGGSPGGGMCPDVMKCLETMYKAIGIDMSDGVSEEEQKKLEEFGNQMAGGLNGICGLTDKVKIGSIMECTQAAAVKCSSLNPFQGITQIFSANSTDTFLAPLVEHLKLMKPDGSINGTGWDLMMAYYCNPGCKDKMDKFATLGSRCNLNAPAGGQDKTALCGEYQKYVECAEETAGDCPLMILSIHSMVKSISKEGQVAEGCDLRLSKPLPDLDAGDSSAGVLAVSTFALLISVSSVLMF